jgi:hypothetical protein
MAVNQEQRTTTKTPVTVTGLEAIYNEAGTPGHLPLHLECNGKEFDAHLVETEAGWAMTLCDEKGLMIAEACPGDGYYDFHGMIVSALTYAIDIGTKEHAG